MLHTKDRLQALHTNIMLSEINLPRDKHFFPFSLIFLCKAGVYLSGASYGAALLFTKIRLAIKSWLGTNTVAYF